MKIEITTGDDQKGERGEKLRKAKQRGNQSKESK